MNAEPSETAPLSRDPLIAALAKLLLAALERRPPERPAPKETAPSRDPEDGARRAVGTDA